MLVVLLVALLPFSAVGNGTPTPAAPSLRVATSGDYPPFSARDSAGQLQGFDIVIAERFATDTQRALAWVTLRWPDLLIQANGDAFDIAMSGVTIRGDRAADLLFSRPYATTGAVAVVPVAAQARFRIPADLDRPEVRLAVNRGGHLERVARRQFPHATIVAVDDNTTLPAKLQDGTAEAAISEVFEARTWSGGRFVTLGPFSRDQKAYAVPRNAAALIPMLDAWLAARESDGWLNTQRRRWMGDAATTTPDQANREALVAAIRRRLQVMPLVAAVKQRDHLPIADAAQEGRVLDQARAAAIAQHLDPEAVASVFRLLIDAGKEIQAETPIASAAVTMTLADLRTVIASANEQIVSELARSQTGLRTSAGRTQLTTLMHTTCGALALDKQVCSQLIESLIAVHPAA